MKTLGVLKYLARTSTAIMTLLVMLAAVTIVQGITFGIASEMRSKRDRQARFRRQFEKRQEQLSEQDKRLRIGQDSTKVFLPDGTVHLLYTPKTLPPAREEAKVVEVYDVNLNLLWQGPKDENPHEYLSWYQMRSDDHHWRGDRVTRKLLNRIQTIGSAFSRSVEVPVGSTERIEGFEIWRYNPACDIFVGYDFNSQRVGYLGSTGLAVSEAEAKPFGKFEQFTAWCPDDSHSPILLWQTERRIYQIDFAKKQVELLFESAESNIKEFRLNYWRFPQPQEPKPHILCRPMIDCRTKDNKHHLIMKDPEEVLTVAIPDEFWDRTVGFAATNKGIFLKYYSSDRWQVWNACEDSYEVFWKWWREHKGEDYKVWMELYRVNESSNIYLLKRHEWTEQVGEKDYYELSTPRPIRWVSTPLYDLAWYLMVKDYLRKSPDNELLQALVQATIGLRPAGSLYNRLLCLLMAGLALWHGWSRRTSWPRLIFWLILTAAFNLAGLLTYLALNHTPLVKCSACGKRRGLQGSACIRCGKELPPPQRRKSDLIFEAATT